MARFWISVFNRVTIFSKGVDAEANALIASYFAKVITLAAESGNAVDRRV
jgi:hypothetical protein